MKFDSVSANGCLLYLVPALDEEDRCAPLRYIKCRLESQSAEMVNTTETSKLVSTGAGENKCTLNSLDYDKPNKTSLGNCLSLSIAYKP